MRILLLILIIALVVSCSGSEIKIKDAEAKNGAKDVSIKTTKVEIGEEPRDVKAMKAHPTLDVISPLESELVKNSTIIVKLQAENFNVVPIGSPVKENEGHFHVWLDSEKRVITDSILVFEGISSGRHSIVAELVKSNHSSLSPKVIKSVNFNVEAPGKESKQEQEILKRHLREYTIEADDRGFYPSRIMSKVGDNVSISFNFRDHLIYYAGLDVYGPFPDVKYKRGDEQPINRNFIMLEETIIRSFWPSTGVKKAELIVEVER